MRIRVLVAVIFGLLLGEPAAAQILPIPPGWQMERAILLSRHGVRSPIKSNEEMDRHVATPWPAWPVPPGFLTPHGAELMRLMGRYYRVLYGGRGLMEASICPPPNTVAAWTDIDQRTRLTGAALLNGMYPGCANPLLRNQDDFTVPDPLFHPQPTPSCPMDPAANRAAVLARIGGNFDSVLREYAPQLKLMQATLVPAAARPSPGRYCGLPSEPPAVEVGPRGWVTISGPIGIGSSAAETFLMESAEGMPANQVAWGRLSGDAELQDLLKIHRLEFDLAHKTLPIARQHGSNLMAQIVGQPAGRPQVPRPAGGSPSRCGLACWSATTPTSPTSRGCSMSAGRSRASSPTSRRPAARSPSNCCARCGPGGATCGSPTTRRRWTRCARRRFSTSSVRPAWWRSTCPAARATCHEKACPLERFVAIANEAIDPGCVTIKP